MPRYDTVDLSRLLDERFDADDLTRRELDEVARNVLTVAQDLRAELNLETDDDVADFLAEAGEDDDDGGEDEGEDDYDDEQEEEDNV